MIYNQQFYKAIMENPLDDGIRLIYSDWLIENGEIDYAEFIKIQIELSKYNHWDEDHKRVGHLVTRQKELFEKNKEKLSLPKSGYFDKFTYRRGFVGCIYTTGTLTNYLNKFPLQGVTLTREPLTDLLKHRNWKFIEEIGFKFTVDSIKDLIKLIPFIEDKRAIRLPRTNKATERRMELFFKKIVNSKVKSIAISLDDFDRDYHERIDRLTILIESYGFIVNIGDWQPFRDKSFQLIEIPNSDKEILNPLERWQ
jgi:uncharacterized protein (TIGR02996 family)